MSSTLSIVTFMDHFVMSLCLSVSLVDLRGIKATAGDICVPQTL